MCHPITPQAPPQSGQMANAEGLTCCTCRSCWRKPPLARATAAQEAADQLQWHVCCCAVLLCQCWPPPCASQQDFKHTLRRSSSCDCTAAGPIILAALATASALAASRAALAVALSTFACTGRGWQRSGCFHLCDRRGLHMQRLAALKRLACVRLRQPAQEAEVDSTQAACTCATAAACTGLPLKLLQPAKEHALALMMHVAFAVWVSCERPQPELLLSATASLLLAEGLHRNNWTGAPYAKIEAAGGTGLLLAAIAAPSRSFCQDGRTIDISSWLRL